MVRTLDSIAGQCVEDRIDLIVVDNNSTDGSVAAVARWHASHPEIDLTILSEPRPGAAVARNTGLAAVTTPYVMFFDSDDLMLPGHVKRAVEGVEEHPEADILGWDIDCQLPDGRFIRPRFVVENPIYNHLVFVILSTQRYMARTELVRRVGGWDADLKGWNDFELGVRLLSVRPNLVKIDKAGSRPLVIRYFTEESITGTMYSVKPDEWELSLDRIEMTLREKCPRALCWVGYRRAVLAALYAREGDKSDARRLLSMASCKGCGRLMTMAIYWFTRVFGRGSRVIASRFMPTDL